VNSSLVDGFGRNAIYRVVKPTGTRISRPPVVWVEERELGYVGAVEPQPGRRSHVGDGPIPASTGAREFRGSDPSSQQRAAIRAVQACEYEANG
jgi:hypothetical protein